MTGWISVDPRDPLPIYAQIDRSLRAAIATGRLAPGAQLPTVRQLAVDLRVNANTVARVYAELERGGLIETRRGIGSFVAASPPAVGATRDRLPELKALVRRFLDDAAARGFSAEDVAKQIRGAKANEGG